MRDARSFVLSIAVGAAAGTLVGGTLARLAMRLVFAANTDARGLETAAGATVGQITTDGTVAVYVASLFVGIALGLAYWISRPFLPGSPRVRAGVFVAGASLLGTALTLADSREDFSFASFELSITLLFLCFALTALPIPLVCERFAPTTTRAPRRVAIGLAVVVLAVFAVFAGYQIDQALDVSRAV